MEGADRNVACWNERVVFTCNVTVGGELQWAIESYNELGRAPFVRFTVLDAPSRSMTHDFFNVTLTWVDQHSIGTFTSILTMFATNGTIGKTVYCSNGVLGSDRAPNATVHVGGMCI